MTAPLIMVHTAQGNVDLFNDLARELAPEIPLQHVMAAELLQDAVAAGELTDDVRRRTRAVMLQAAARAPEDAVVICTCSTVGPGADDAAAEAELPVLRVDRPMMAEAIAKGSRILVAAALKSTIDPTMNLLRDVAAELGAEIEADYLLMDEAREMLMSGRLEEYKETVAQGLREGAARADVIILAQASMAPALELLADVKTPMLTSPRSGFLQAAAVWRERNRPA